MRATMPLLIFMLCALFWPINAFASPPPKEIAKAKAEAPVHLIGVVTSDQLYQDLATETDRPSQIRRITLSAKRIIKAPPHQPLSEATVYYVYVPSWQRDEIVGAAPLYMARGDVVEVWLKQGKMGWEPVLGGWTVRHLSYAPKRIEPIREPFWHTITRHVQAGWRHHSDAIMFCSVVLFLLIFVLLVNFKGSKAVH
ncbi:hypothetical protein [Anoxybacteroides tepidamans]|uniref:hypothetical protein n=1 Tax=Anoxybacteroides tepidamans TaxID=265948 RepID=UPI0004827BC3|nr:hypothetical protein [Anoxybacillus tepidamans]